MFVLGIDTFTGYDDYAGGSVERLQAYRDVRLGVTELARLGPSLERNSVKEQRDSWPLEIGESRKNSDTKRAAPPSFGQAPATDTLLCLPTEIKQALFVHLPLADAVRLSATCHAFRSIFLSEMRRRIDWANSAGASFSAHLAHPARSLHRRPTTHYFGAPVCLAKHRPDSQKLNDAAAFFCFRYASRADTVTLCSLILTKEEQQQLHHVMPDATRLDGYTAEAHCIHHYQSFPPESLHAPWSRVLETFDKVYRFRSGTLVREALLHYARRGRQIAHYGEVQRHTMTAFLPNTDNDDPSGINVLQFDAFLGSRERQEFLCGGQSQCLLAPFGGATTLEENPYFALDLPEIRSLHLLLPPAPNRARTTDNWFSSTAVLRRAVEMALIEDLRHTARQLRHPLVLSDLELLGHNLISLQAQHRCTPQLCPLLFPKICVPLLRDVVVKQIWSLVKRDADEIHLFLDALEERLQKGLSSRHLQHVNVSLLMPHVSFFGQVQALLAAMGAPILIPSFPHLMSAQRDVSRYTLQERLVALRQQFPALQVQFICAATPPARDDQANALEKPTLPFGRWQYDLPLTQDEPFTLQWTYHANPQQWAFDLTFHRLDER